jgi:hypothetical protein
MVAWVAGWGPEARVSVRAYWERDADGARVVIDFALAHTLCGEAEARKVVLEEHLRVLGAEQRDGVARHLAQADAAVARWLAAGELAPHAVDDAVEVSHGLDHVHLVVGGVHLAPPAEGVDGALQRGLAAADELAQRDEEEAQRHDAHDERVDLLGHAGDPLVADDRLELAAYPLLHVVARVHEGRRHKPWAGMGEQDG